MQVVSVLHRVLRGPVRKILGTAAAAAFLSFAAGSAFAQAIPTAGKAADMSVFGGASYGTPDYGQPNIKGGVVGFDYTRYLPFPVAPGVEIRATDLHGDQINEKTITGGLRAQMDFRQRFHPYGDFLIGGGVLHFAHPQYPGYLSDRGSVYSLGGGVDIGITRRFEARIDVQSQHWNLGKNLHMMPSGGDFILTPINYSVGIAYRFPFRPHNRQSDYFR